MQIIINKLCCAWMRSHSCSFEEVQLIRSWAKRDGGMKGRKKGRGNKSKDETVLVPMLSPWSWKVLSITVKCFTAQRARTPLPKPTHSALCAFSADGGLSIFCFNSSILNQYDSPNSKSKATRERNCVLHDADQAPPYSTKREWHCWAPWWCRVGISFRAAQNYIETYYLHLKATQVSLIYSTRQPTHKPAASTARLPC